MTAGVTTERLDVFWFYKLRPDNSVSHFFYQRLIIISKDLLVEELANEAAKSY